MKLRIDAKYVPVLASAAVLVLLYAGGCVAFGQRGFTELRVVTNLFRDENAVLGIAAIGATFVILSGGIDLSVGSLVGLTSILIATLTFDPALDPRVVGKVSEVLPHGLHPLHAIAAALAFGSLFGAAMGCLIHFFKLPPFLVTLGGLFFARGIAFTIKSESLGIRHAFYTRTLAYDLVIRLTDRVDLPFTVVCLAILFVLGLCVLHLARFGRSVYAIGGDEQSAVLMGLPVGKTKVLVYTFAGFCSASAGVVYTFAVSKGDPLNAGMGLELDAIASTVIGGTLLSGGVGFLAGTLMGVLIFGLIQTLINFQGSLSAWWTRIAVGALVLLFILLQNFVSAASRRSARRQASPPGGTGIH
ncbi:MAG: sugar ABC transporter permease YjfF [Phycisphaerae bacterium]